MDDLISRSVLIKRCEDMCKSQLIGNKNTTLISFGDVIDTVYEQPTAYNMDKVGEQLEQLRADYIKE